MNIRTKKGFTLVEIMIVVVIIGLLAAMAIPAFQKVRAESMAKLMINDARQIGSALQQLSTEYAGVLNGETVTLTYTPATGVITQPAASSGGNIPALAMDGYLNRLSKGMNLANIVVTIQLDNPNAEGFFLQHRQVSPVDCIKGSTTNILTTPDSPVSFYSDGKARM